ALLLVVRPRLESKKTPAPVAQVEAPGAAGRMAAGKPARAPARGPEPGGVRPPGEPIARLEALDGPAYRHGIDGTVRAAPVLDVAAGDWVSTSGPTARARLAGPDGSRGELTGGAVGGLTTD